jgi:type VI secretion system protein VasI
VIAVGIGVGAAACGGKVTPQVPRLETPTKWQTVRERSPLDDSPTVVLTIKAEEPVTVGSGRTVIPELFIRCQEKRTDVYVWTGMKPGSTDTVCTGCIALAPETAKERNFGYKLAHGDSWVTAGGLVNFVLPKDPEKDREDERLRAVTIRLSDREPYTYDWRVSTTHDALFAPDAIRISKRMAKADTMRFRFTPYEYSPQVATFDVHGLDPALVELREACDW